MSDKDDQKWDEEIQQLKKYKVSKVEKEGPMNFEILIDEIPAWASILDISRENPLCETFVLTTPKLKRFINSNRKELQAIQKERVLKFLSYSRSHSISDQLTIINNIISRVGVHKDGKILAGKDLLPIEKVFEDILQREKDNIKAIKDLYR